MPHKHIDQYMPEYQLPKPLKAMDNNTKNRTNKKKASKIPPLELPRSIKSTNRSKGM